MKRLRPILLVEDSMLDAELTRTGLEENGLSNEIVHVLDGAQALDYLFRRGDYADREEAQPAAILLDLKMPKVDGLEALKAIKADSALKTLPVIIFTSSREESDLAAGYNLGANAYVVKPIGYQEFAKAIQGIGVFWAVLNEPPFALPNAATGTQDPLAPLRGSE